MLTHGHLGEELAKRLRRAVDTRHPDLHGLEQDGRNHTVRQGRRRDIRLDSLVRGSVYGGRPDGDGVQQRVFLAQLREGYFSLALDAGEYGGETTGLLCGSAPRDVDEVEGLVFAGEI